MASEIYLNESVWSSLLVGYKKAKLKGHGPTLEETWPDHAIRSSIAIFKLPLGCDIQKTKKKKNNNNNNNKINNNKKENENNFSLDFFKLVWLSNSTCTVRTAACALLLRNTASKFYGV